MAIAMVQEFPVDADDRSTSNYDGVQARLNVTGDPPAGLLLHTAGFTGTGVFRIFGVWNSEQDWQRFREERLMPAVAPHMESGGRRPNEYTYELHDLFQP
jgi:hypothetical protein